jgi:hypothetical protein
VQLTLLASATALTACSAKNAAGTADGSINNPDASIADAIANPCTPLAQTAHVRLCSVERSARNPLITPATHPGISNNITMPSVLRVPPALAATMGGDSYWMYFAAHDGRYIRLAHAAAPEGPWITYAPGSLKDTEVAPFSDTISSPDVMVLPSQKVRMYFSTDKYPGSTEQWSGVAESSDGVTFTLASTQNIAKYYMRVFGWGGKQYALQKGWSTAPAELGESPNGVDRFAFIKTLTGGSIRHMGIHLDGSTLLIFYSVIGDAPERILLSTMRLDQGAPASWELSPPIEVLRSTTAYEGVNFPMTPSVKGPATNVHQLRDPYVFVDNGKTYLYYGIAGESGIAVAEVHYQIIP